MLTAAERRLGVVLRLTAFGLFVAAVVYALGPFVGPAQAFFNELPFVANSVVKVTLLGLVSLYAIGLDGVITLGVAGFFYAAWRSTRGVETPAPAGAEREAGAESLLRWVLIVFAVLFALGGVGYELAPFLGTSKEFAHELPFVTNSVVRMATLAMLCVYAAVNLRRNAALVGPVVLAQFLGVVVGGAYLVDQYATAADATVPLPGGEPQLTTVMWWAVGHEAVSGAIILAAYVFALRRRYRLGFLWVSSYRALAAGSRVLLPGGGGIGPEDVAARVEAFLQRFRARRRWLYKVALATLEFAPLVELRPLPRVNPPLSELDPESRRRFLEQHFQRLKRQSRIRFLKNLKQIVIRICLQLAYAGYYGDPKSYDSIGYKPFTERPVYADLPIEEPGEHPLEVERPEQIGSEVIEAEVCIVGSGAGGSILAHQLAKAGRDVLILERGEY